MKIVVTAPDLIALGGVQTYLLTVATALERLGHEVVLWSDRDGEIGDYASSQGLTVARQESDLPASADAVLAQDRSTALVAASLWPEAVRGIVVHSAESDGHLPPSTEGAVAFAVVMNGAVARRVAASARAPEVVRLRQPIDLERFAPASAPRQPPLRLLMLGNYLRGPRRQGMVDACERLGIDWRQVGRHGTFEFDPARSLASADIVVGQGRSLLEGMASGCAALLLGQGEGDGWVTADTYPAFEDDGFRGRATTAALTGGAREHQLGEYESGMGEVNRALTLNNHSVHLHATQLVETISAHRDPRRPDPSTPLREMALLVRTQHTTKGRVAAVRDELRASEAERRQLEHEILRLGAQAGVLHDRLAALTATRRWRAMTLLARPFDALRRALRRRA